jgi:hypothetical protein
MTYKEGRWKREKKQDKRAAALRLRPWFVDGGRPAAARPKDGLRYTANRRNAGKSRHHATKQDSIRARERTLQG